MNDFETGSSALPLVIQLGFAGSRRLLDCDANPKVDPAAFEAQIQALLAERLRKLRIDLRLDARHFFCGIAAVAVGGDTIFSRACQAEGICQRVFLPQTRDEFLKACGSNSPDFSEAQKAEAVALLDSPHVIQERLVSDSPVREERFEDVNREIVRVSDVLLCLLREGAVGKPGGTEDLVARAVQRGKPVLVIHVGVADGKPALVEQWRLPAGWMSPALPAAALEPPRTLKGVPLPAGDGKASLIERYATAVKGVASATAAQMQAKFKQMVKLIIGTHIVATVLAAIVMGFGRFDWPFMPVLLLLELVMLAVGLSVHHLLHHSRASHYWAEARLLAEMTRSVLAVGKLHLYLGYFFSLPFPKAVRPVLRTLNVLHLRCTRHDREDWQPKRDRYVQQRLAMKRNGQLDFCRRRKGESERQLKQLHLAFHLCWAVAFLSTSLKLILHHWLEQQAVTGEVLIGLLGTLAIVMPVLAAGALSLAGAMDLEAQEHTYREMLDFLQQQENNLKSAGSERDYAALVLETESIVLGETANWFSRRSFIGVA